MSAVVETKALLRDLQKQITHQISEVSSGWWNVDARIGQVKIVSVQNNVLKVFHQGECHVWMGGAAIRQHANDIIQLVKSNFVQNQ